jgi:hypothetical protein
MRRARRRVRLLVDDEVALLADVGDEPIELLAGSIALTRRRSSSRWPKRE